MTGLEFLASVIASLAWPATAVALVVILRRPLSAVLMKTKRLKYKDLEMDFEQELKELEAKARAISVEPKQKALEPDARSVDAQTLLSQAESLADELPHVTVALAWSAVEDSLAGAVMRLAVSPDYPPYNSSSKNAQLLLGQGLIDKETLALLDGMRTLRNAVVHRAAEAPVTADQAREYLALARGICEKTDALDR